MHYMAKNFEQTMIGSFVRSVEKWVLSCHVKKAGDRYFLTDKGILVSDAILSDCMIAG